MARLTADEIGDLRRNVGADPLRVLRSCAIVLEETDHVWIERTALHALADTLLATDVTVPGWDDILHFRAEGVNGHERTAGWIFVLDALNFCFWGQDDDPGHRWRVAWNGAIHNGYAALAAALSKAAEGGTPVWDPVWLATIDAATIGEMFAPIPGSAEIPLPEARLMHLRELGNGMIPFICGGDGAGLSTPFSTFIARSNGSAVELVRSIIATCPSFDDVAVWTSPPGSRRAGSVHAIHFYKRAQILVSDLAGSLGDTPLGSFHDRDLLTAFADYKVPQVLRHLGILGYHPALAARIRRYGRIPAASRDEIAIRAATIWACELIRRELGAGGRVMTASDIDWLLWNAGQDLPDAAEPYHRTVTTCY